MNKKGFTLIELLCSITIMSLITTIASLNIISIFDAKKEQTIILENEIIETATCTYIELDKNKSLKLKCLNFGCEIKSDLLVSEGLLKEENYKDVNIKIYTENNTKKCIIK